MDEVNLKSFALGLLENISESCMHLFLFLNVSEIVRNYKQYQQHLSFVEMFQNVSVL